MCNGHAWLYGRHAWPHCSSRRMPACMHAPPSHYISPTRRIDARPPQRRCKKCLAVIEKNGGCNWINCRCGHQFCYFCHSTDPSHHDQPCNAPPPPEAEGAQSELTYFMHYYDRYACHSCFHMACALPTRPPLLMFPAHLLRGVCTRVVATRAIARVRSSRRSCAPR